MGFSRKQAIEALEATGNDVTNAIAHLFGDLPPAPPSLPLRDSSVQPQTSVQIRNPNEIPQFVGEYASSAGSDPFADYPSLQKPGYSEEWDANETTIKESDEVDLVHIEDQNGSESVSIQQEIERSDTLDSDMSFALPENIKTERNLFPMILAKDQKNKCWPPLLSILCSYLPFAKAVLEADATDDVVKDLQRIVYFFMHYSESKRWYIDASRITEAFLREANFQFMDEEVVLRMIEKLVATVPTLRDIFVTLIETSDDENKADLMVLEVESDSRLPTLYETLNEMIWHKDFSMLGCVKFDTVAPLMTYQLVCDEETYTTPFDLCEIHYPEIYSALYVDTIKEQIELIKQAQTAHHELARKLMGLNFFEGKRIDNMLDASKTALANLSNGVSEDLSSLKSQLSELRTTELANQSKYKETASPERLKSFDKIILANPQLKAYILIGVIISESKFYVRSNNQWIQMEDNEAIEFDEVKEIVRDVSRRGPHVITLIYADSTTLIKSENEITTDPLESASSDLIELDSASLELQACKSEGSAEVTEFPEVTHEPQELKKIEKAEAEPTDLTEVPEKSQTKENSTIRVKPELAQQFAAEESDVSIY